VSERVTRKLLFIGWDAADWRVINPLMDAGKMPHLQRLVERGVMGNMATLHPVLSPMLCGPLRPSRSRTFACSAPRQAKRDDAVRRLRLDP
jgi:predicted AlkP superfamily phosphohydrolase/phosphomutase